jgi:hypothetical protein
VEKMKEELPQLRLKPSDLAFKRGILSSTLLLKAAVSIASRFYVGYTGAMVLYPLGTMCALAWRLDL